jgi:hypothetical protein
MLIRHLHGSLHSILSSSTIYMILAWHEDLPEDGLLTSKHVGANYI